MTTIRESIPTEDIIRAYMDESIEHEEEVTIERIYEKEEETAKIEKTEKTEDSENTEKTEKTENVNNIPTTIDILGVTDKDDVDVTTRLKFSDYDSVLDGIDTLASICAPKSLERLEEISASHALQKRLDESELEPIVFDKMTDDADIGLFGIEEI